jgi:hypothetical protein
MKKSVVLLALALVSILKVEAHPGVGIVMDRHGNVFYTDLVQIWRITPDGRRSVVVPKVHTHELAVISGDILIGEEVRSAGGGWQHRLWQRRPDGRITDVVAWQEGFWQDRGLNRDRAGATYSVQCPEKVCVIRKRGRDGSTTILARGSQFNYPVNWLAVSPSGIVFFNDGPDLRKIDERGTVSTVGAGLGPPDNQNALMGLKAVVDGSVYVAVPSRRSILRVGADGSISTAAQSPDPWAPSGMLTAPDGTLWILEFDPANRVQVRRIGPRGEVTVFGAP